MHLSYFYQQFDWVCPSKTSLTACDMDFAKQTLKYVVEFSPKHEISGLVAPERVAKGPQRECHCWLPSKESTLAKAHDPIPERDIRLISCFVCATQISRGGLLGK